MKRWSMWIVAAAVATAASGCSLMSKLDTVSGTEVTQERMKGFQKGKTTRQDVIAALCHPTQKSEVKGNEVWSYPYTRITAMPGAPTGSDSTVFECDKIGLLLNAYKTGGTPGKIGIPMLD